MVKSVEVFVISSNGLFCGKKSNLRLHTKHINNNNLELSKVKSNFEEKVGNSKLDKFDQRSLKIVSFIQGDRG